MQVTEQTDSLSILWMNHMIELDPTVPNVNCLGIESMLAPQGNQMCVRWSRCKSRVTLLHIYDCLIAAGVPIHPPKADALVAWDELHPSTSVTPVTSDSADMQMGVPSQGGRVMMLGDSFDQLLKMDNETYINHVWVICQALHFPMAVFEGFHVAIASELFQRCTSENTGDTVGVRPQVFIRSYRYKNVVSPLLVWYRIQENEVICALQEFLHVRFSHVPQAVVWYWQLLPYYVNVSNMGRNMDAEELLPSVRKLLKFAAVKASSEHIDMERLHIRGQRHSDRMSTEYGNGICALWVGEDVFFYVEDKSDQVLGALRNVRLPSNHSELPGWVMELLREASMSTDFFGIARNVDSYLTRIATNPAPALRLLRTINWALVPLVWKPLFMKNAQVTVTPAQAADAQSRLLKELTPSWEEPETIAEAIELLNRFTGV